MELLKPLILQVLTPQCYDEFFVDFNFFHVECLKAAVSKALGIVIIAGSVLVKVPQILKLLRSKSGQGISVVGLLMELFGLASNVAYSFRNEFPFSAYGDGLFLYLQTSIILTLVLFYGPNPVKGKVAQTNTVQALSAAAALAAGFALLLSPVAPMQLLYLFQTALIPLIVTAKMIQATANYKAGSTGQLSAVTIFMQTGGAVARIFTSMQETGDVMLVLIYVASSLSNGVICAQMIYYWNAVPAAKKSKARPKKE